MTDYTTDTHLTEDERQTAADGTLAAERRAYVDAHLADCEACAADVARIAEFMADNVSVLIRSTLLQVLTPEHLLGRVSSVNAIFVGSSNELGAFESGVAARFLGTVPSVVLGGLASLSVVLVIGAVVPRLRRLGRIDEVVPAEVRPNAA